MPATLSLIGRLAYVSDNTWEERFVPWEQRPRRANVREAEFETRIGKATLLSRDFCNLELFCFRLMMLAGETNEVDVLPFLQRALKSGRKPPKLSLMVYTPERWAVVGWCACLVCCAFPLIDPFSMHSCDPPLLLPFRARLSPPSLCPVLWACPYLRAPNVVYRETSRPLTHPLPLPLCSFDQGVDKIPFSVCQCTQAGVSGAHAWPGHWPQMD